MPQQANNVKQVDSLGETPAEARARMEAAGRASAPPKVTGGDRMPPIPGVPPEISAEIEGFGGEVQDGGVVETHGDRVEAPTPTKAAEFIQELSQAKLQLQTELDAALNVIERYRAAYGELD